MFKTVKFMTAAEKEKVLKDWIRFIRGGCKFSQFTKALYNHLIQHCSFIAHYNRAGFYDTYFAPPANGSVFFRQFNRSYDCKSVEYGWDIWLSDPDYADINNAMVDAYTYRGAQEVIFS